MLRRQICVASLALVLSLPLYAASSDDYLEEAKGFLRNGDARSAVIQLKNALQEDPANLEARLILGRIYLRLEDGASAEKELRRAARLKASPERWQADLGRALLLQRKYDAVIEEIKPDPTQPGEAQAMVYALQGQAWLGKRDLEQARKAFQKALEIHPGQVEARLGNIRVDLASGDRAKGEEQLNAFLKDHPDHIAALLLRAELARQQKRLDAALADFDHVLERKPNDLRALLGRASVHLARRDFEGLEADLKQLDEIAPGAPIVEYLKGTSAFQQQRFDQAEEHLQKVLSTLPNHTQSQLMLGAILYSRGELTLADEYLTQAYGRLKNHLPTVKLLAATRIKMNQPKRAIQVLEPAVDRNGEDAQLLAMLGNAYLRVGRFQEGSDLLARAVELAPELASLRTQLAFGLLAQGDTSKAIGELESAVKLDQDLIQADVLLVLSHLRNGETEAALKASKALEQRMPKNPVAHNLTGLAYLSAGDMEKARAAFEKALEVDPGFTTARINLARIAIKQGDMAGAERQFRAALERSPGDMNALIGMAGLAERSGDLKAMYDWLQKAREANPKVPRPGLLLVQAYRKAGENLKALQVANELASAFPNRPAVLRALGLAQVEAGENNSAVRSLRQLAEFQPNPANYTLLAKAQRRTKDESGAAQSLDQALKLDPGFLPALTERGAMALAQRDFDAALEIAKEIGAKYPDSAVADELAGSALLGQNRVEEAIAALERAFGKRPNARLVVRLARLEASRGQPEKAVGRLESWLADHPEDVSTRMVYAVMLHGMGRNEAARRAYEQVLEKMPNNTTALNNLAWIYQEKGDRRAVELARRAYDQASDRPEIVDTYGWTLVQLGDVAKGLSLLQEAHAKAPENPEIAYHTGQALLKAGRTEEGRKLLQRLVRDHGDSPFAAKAKELLQ